MHVKRHAMNLLPSEKIVLPSAARRAEARDLWPVKGTRTGIDRRSMGRRASPRGVPTQSMGTSFRVDGGKLSHGIKVYDRRYNFHPDWLWRL